MSKSLASAKHGDRVFLKSLQNKWQQAERACFELLDFKEERINSTNALDLSISKSLWTAFDEWCSKIENDEEGDSLTKALCTSLMVRRTKRRVINFVPAILSPLLNHPSFEMFNYTDVKREFGLDARHLWAEQDVFEKIIETCSENSSIKMKACFLLDTYGKDGIENKVTPCMELLTEIQKSNEFAIFTLQKLQRMCQLHVDTIEEEQELILKREILDGCFLRFQREFLQIGPLRAITIALYKKTPINILVIQVLSLKSFFVCGINYFGWKYSDIRKSSVGISNHNDLSLNSSESITIVVRNC